MPRSLSRRVVLRQLLGAAGAVGALTLPGCGGPSRAELAAAPAPAPAAAYPRPEALYDAAQLVAADAGAAPRLLDCSALSDYRHGHLPGARHVWWQDTIEVHNPVYGMLVGAPGRERLLADAGVAPGSAVVCYDGSGGVYAARLVWLLHVVGLSDARLLNGGRQAWAQRGGALTRATLAAGGGSGLGATVDESLLAHGADLAARLGDPALTVLDTRTAAERRETWNGALRRGAIPGSRWLPRDAWLTSGPVPALRGPDELRGRLSAAGVALDAPDIVVYGLHGTLAALAYVALRALGAARVRVYDGSWAEWGANLAWPVAPLP